MLDYQRNEVLNGNAIATPSPSSRVMVVDDEPATRNLCRLILEPDGISCDEAPDGLVALQNVRTSPYDLVLLDVDMPGVQGTEVLRQLRENPPWPNLKVIMISGRATADEMACMMRAGTDDFLGKPISAVQLRERVKTALRLKDAQDHSDLLAGRLLAVNHELDQNLTTLNRNLVDARSAFVLGLIELVACRDAETGAHLLRLRHYCRLLAEEAAGLPCFAGRIDGHFVSMLECCVPLHDIGKIGVPDSILLKLGKLTPDERLVMERHTVLAANTLEKVARQHGFAFGFMQMAKEIARHHHERYDGTGYPDRLAGEDIPLAARIVAIGDVYDALRSRRVYKPALPHAEAMRVMAGEGGRQFDPALLALFQHKCADRFDRLFQELSD